uniref:Cyclase n=1 Tax=Bionectria ochroleuca TaxID=29856 RepID=A0A8H7MYU5_BIOOC
MGKIDVPGRKHAEHKFLYNPDSMGFAVGESWDDELSINTQNSSQWDSLCHFAHQSTAQVYNGFRLTHEVLAAAAAPSSDAPVPTLDHWHAHGGLVARGVLIDYMAYAEDKGIPYHPFAGTRIGPADMEACAAHQGVEFRPGDVLIVRTGMTEVFDALTPEQLRAAAEVDTVTMSGVHGSVETAKWIWNHRFVAVASDNNSVEALPPLKADGSPGGLDELGMSPSSPPYLERTPVFFFPPRLSTSSCLIPLVCQNNADHTNLRGNSPPPLLLCGFGMPLGELWDLTRLSKLCREKKRYSFMVTSVPLNHPGLIGSPPNALAIL